MSIQAIESLENSNEMNLGFSKPGFFSNLNLNNDKHPYITDICYLIIDKLRCVHDSAY